MDGLLAIMVTIDISALLSNFKKMPFVDNLQEAKYITIRVFAALLGFNEKTVRKYIRNGQLPIKKIEHRTMIEKEQAEIFIKTFPFKQIRIETEAKAYYVRMASVRAGGLVPHAYLIKTEENIFIYKKNKTDKTEVLFHKIRKIRFQFKYPTNKNIQHSENAIKTGQDKEFKIILLRGTSAENLIDQFRNKKGIRKLFTPETQVVPFPDSFSKLIKTEEVLTEQERELIKSNLSAIEGKIGKKNLRGLLTLLYADHVSFDGSSATFRASF